MDRREYIAGALRHFLLQLFEPVEDDADFLGVDAVGPRRRPQRTLPVRRHVEDGAAGLEAHERDRVAGGELTRAVHRHGVNLTGISVDQLTAVAAPRCADRERSEERRVGKECRSRWARYQ